MRKARAVAPIRITPKQAFWRTGMLAGGKTHEEIAAASARRYELRPRTAFRHAHDWTFLATVAHINAVAIDLGVVAVGMQFITASRLRDTEHWPFLVRKIQVSAYHLGLLAVVYGAVYGMDVPHLLDDADRRHQRPADRFLIGLIGDARTPSVGGARPTRVRRPGTTR